MDPSSWMRMGMRMHSMKTTYQKRIANLQFQIRHHSILKNGKPVSAMKRDLSQSTAAATQTQEQQQVESWELNLSGADEHRLHGKRGDWWWSGKKPDEIVEPGQNTLYSLAQPTLENVTEQSVKKYFDNTWTLTEVLFSGLQGEEAFYRPPYHHLRHPMIFYYGHTATFYTNKLYVAGILDKGINPYFEDIFEVGVDEMRWDDMSKNAMQWPTVGEVHEYRTQVYETVSNIIDETLGKNGGMDRKVTEDHPLWSLFMSFEHDRIHLETSSVLLREMPLNQLRKPEFWPEPHSSAFANHGVELNPARGVDYPVNEFVKVKSAEKVFIGKERDFPSYGWDNEYGERIHEEIPEFEAGKFMVSNGEFYEFVKDGGYREKSYWTEEGWGWRTFRNAKAPFFWEQSGPSGKHQFKLRTIFEVVEMPWSWPVNVNKHEASAFCAWKAKKDSSLQGLRLVTEPEHMLLREKSQRHPIEQPNDDPALVHGGMTMSSEAGVNLNLAHGSETPVDMHAPNENGFFDVTGNAWEWAEDDFNPLPGFKVHNYYDDFSTPCFDGEHNMILGGSFVSSGDAGANLHCRYHFRPHFLQHSGFRYVMPSKNESYPGSGVATKLKVVDKMDSESDSDSDSGISTSTPGQQTYETDQLINQYLALHFGQADDVVDETIRNHGERPRGALNFPKRCAELVQQVAESNNAPIGKDAKVLDLGCAVGGSSFELSKHYGSVTGIDFSNAFIDTAKRIQTAPNKAIEFSVQVEGNIERDGILAKLDPSFDYSNIQFLQGDACNLPSAQEIGGPFDAILMANLICRLPDPEKCLASLGSILSDDGVIVTVSPFSWLEEFTSEENWLQQGQKPSADVLKQLMAGYGFQQIYSRDMPLLIREHERKYQYIISNAAAFKRL